MNKRKYEIIPETTAEQWERGDRRMAVVQHLNIDPFVHSFEARGDAPNEQARMHGHLVHEILVGSKQLERVVRRLESNTGCFEDRDACAIMEELVEYVQDDLFEDLTEEDTPVAREHVWALGVIMYYLLCGYQWLGTQSRLECYKYMRIGPKPHSDAWKAMERGGHKFPSRDWCSIGDPAKKFIKHLTHYHPGNRPSFVDIWDTDGLAWYNYNSMAPSLKETPKELEFCRRWIRLYYQRWDSIIAFEEFRIAPVPDGAWDRVGRWGLSNDGDHCYDHNCIGKHGDPLSTGWVIENSIPRFQREEKVLETSCEWEEPYHPPILQVVKIIPEKVRKGCLFLSDGDLFVLGILHPRLEFLTNKLRSNIVVEVKEYRIDYNPVPIVHILSLEIWNDVITWRIRAPKPLTQYNLRDLKYTETH